MARISASTERAPRLVADLLDFTQVRLGGGLRIELRDVEVHPLVAECLDEVRLSWPGRMLDARTVGNGSARLDPDHIAQIVGNLTSNALTYGAPDQPATITTVVREDDTELRVHNHGRPIPPDQLPYLFEPMRRGPQSVKLGSRSIGLGLFIV